MRRYRAFYIDGHWAEPGGRRSRDLINPADESVYGQLELSEAHDVDAAVSAAQKAFESWSRSTLSERLDWLCRVRDLYAARAADIAEAVTLEMGAPIRFSHEQQTASGAEHIESFLRSFERFSFERSLYADDDSHRILREPIGVCGLITPWNFPINQVVLKVLPAIGVGCAVVLKPSELAPLSANIFAEIIAASGLPAGVFNMVHGEGRDVGHAIAAHPDIDMVSFTGSTAAGTAVAHAAADTVKRVTLELGGKSPNIIFADSDVETAVADGVATCFRNSGQCCNAPTRMLVERSVYERAVAAAADAANGTVVGNPGAQGEHIGPVASQPQFERVQSLIRQGIEDGARLVAGGPGRAAGFNSGFYVRPTVFADVTPDMAIARQEIFGPVLCILPFDSEEEAVRIANDTDYGLAAYLQTGDAARARRITRRLRAGMVHINGSGQHPDAPFGGYKRSGTGREAGSWSLEAFQETKAVSGWR